MRVIQNRGCQKGYMYMEIVTNNNYKYKNKSRQLSGAAARTGDLRRKK